MVDAPRLGLWELNRENVKLLYAAEKKSKKCSMKQGRRCRCIVSPETYLAYFRFAFFNSSCRSFRSVL